MWCEFLSDMLPKCFTLCVKISAWASAISDINDVEKLAKRSVVFIFCSVPVVGIFPLAG